MPNANRCRTARRSWTYAEVLGQDLKVGDTLHYGPGRDGRITTFFIQPMAGHHQAWAYVDGFRWPFVIGIGERVTVLRDVEVPQ